MTVDSVLSDNPHVRVIDTPSFVRLEADNSFSVDVRDIADRLGRDLHLADWMVNLSTYVGRIHVEGDTITFTSDMLQFDRPGD